MDGLFDYWGVVKTQNITHLGSVFCCRQLRDSALELDNLKTMALNSVVEPFHFGSAPASQDGGSGSSSSSSPVVHNLLLEKKFRKNSLLNLPGLVLFTETYQCFALLFQYFTKRDRLI